MFFPKANEPAEARWDVNGNILAKMMVDGPPNPWANSTNPGHIFWHLRYKRIPSCEKKSEDKEFWKNDYQPCCKGHKSKENCERWVQNRIRHISTDVGLYLKWDIDQNGLPTGCDAFYKGKRKNRRPMTEEDFLVETKQKSSSLTSTSSAVTSALNLLLFLSFLALWRQG